MKLYKHLPLLVVLCAWLLHLFDLLVFPESLSLALDLVQLLALVAILKRLQNASSKT